jgi:uncharacterized repeat protein (TIGR01451 family)
VRKNNPKSSRFSAGAASARLLFLAIGLTAVVVVAAIGVDAKLRSMFQDTDLGVSKLGPDTTSPGANVTYTITVINAGPDNADNATLTDPLPAGTTFVSISCPAGWGCSTPAVGVNGTVTATNPSLPLTSGDVFTLVVHVDPAIALGTFINNQATVSSNTPDVNSENDRSTFSTLVPGPIADIGITKLGQPDSVTPDSDVAYTMTVSNSGPDAAANVVLNDPLPSEVDFISLVSLAGWSCTTPSVNTNGTVRCTRPTLTVADGPQTFTLVGHFSAGLTPDPNNPTIVTNEATVSSDTNDTNPDNNVYAATTLVVSCVATPVVTNNLDSGPGSLRQAIHDACVGGNITFDMTQVTSPITLTSAELPISRDLTIQGPGANLLSIQRSTAIGTPIFRIFNIGSSTVTISGLTIANGNAADGAVGGTNPGANGGGISNTGTLTITNSTISGSQAGSGGSNVGGTGGTGGNGGGIYSSGTLNIANSTISGNQAGTGGNGGGSGIGGHGGNGGGIANTGTLAVTNSTISGNHAGNGGNAGSSGTGGTGGDGGGFLSDNTATMNNCTISGNQVGNGGLAGDNGAASSGRGGGLYKGTVAVVNLRNSIIAGNSSGAGPDINATVNSQDYNLIGSTSGATITGTITHNIINTSPNLGALASNGGPTQTMLPLPGSPAINAGNPANLPADTFDLDGDSNTAEPLPVDQRGFARVVGANFDLGAVETNYTITATAGTPQSAVITSAFAAAMKANVKESGNNQIGIPVTFAAPVSGASGTFSGSAIVNTDASGVATAPTFTANGTAGGPYSVVASIGTGLPTASFALTNTKATTSTAVSSSPNPSNFGQSVTFTATVTSTAGTPTGTVQFKDGGTTIGSQALNGSGVATFATSSLVAGLRTITADYGGDANFLLSTGTLSGGQQVGAIIRFSSTTYNTTESSGSTTITVQRSGELSSAVTVDYATPDDSAATPTILPCSTPGFVSPRCDFTTAIGTLKFAAGEASKTFVVLISQDNYVEGPESLSLTLSNPTGGAGLGTPSTATLTIADDVVEPATNPIDDANNFVRQHYHDFLNREPDTSGLAFWTNEITSCGTNAQCIASKRINVSAAFYLSIEFQNTGYLVERLYKTSYGDASGTSTIGGSHLLAVPIVRFSEFLPDTQTIEQGLVVGQTGWETVLDNNKQAFVAEFVTRSRFTTAYANTLTPAQFVDLLFANAGVVPTSTERQAAIDEFGGAGTSANAAARGRALRRVAESTTLAQQEFNRAIVLMQYFGYLRRNPNSAPDSDYSGYDFWLTKLNSFTQPGDDVLVRIQKAEMVKAFIISTEYRQRFGTP